MKTRNTRKCGECGTEFHRKGKNHWTKFCGHYCAHVWNNRKQKYGAAYQRKNNLLGKRPRKQRFCSICSKDITTDGRWRLRCAGCKKKYGLSRPTVRGKKHWNWKGGIRSGRSKAMGRVKYKTWRTEVYKRDNYTCVWCGERGKVLHADHIKLWSKFPRYRYVLSNGRTLCVKCHRKRHRKIN